MSSRQKQYVVLFSDGTSKSIRGNSEADAWMASGLNIDRFIDAGRWQQRSKAAA